MAQPATGIAKQCGQIATNLGELTSYPTSMHPSRLEPRTQGCRLMNFEAAIRSLHDGVVIVENGKMVQDAYFLHGKKENSPYTYSPGNIQQDTLRLIWMVADPIASQITSTALGPRLEWTSCSGNTTVPPTPTTPPTSQPVRSDVDFPRPAHPLAYVINVPLIAMTPENGSTDVWLCTHKTGVENQTEVPRAMLAMSRLEFADDLKSTVEGQNELELSSYLNRGFGNADEFNQSA
ncbi:hypothetical protein BDW68DRAFT_190615 [Aspergillus falconensis]